MGVPVNTRAMTAGRGPEESDPSALPHQRPPAPGRTRDTAWSSRSQPRPSPRVLSPQPARPRARSPRTHWLPHCTALASVLRGRRGYSFDSDSGSGRCPAALPPGYRPPRPAGRPTPRPRQPPPTRERWGRSRPRARPGQSSPYLRAEEQPRKWVGDWSGLLKGPRPTELGERGGGRVNWKSSGWEG